MNQAETQLGFVGTRCDIAEKHDFFIVIGGNMGFSIRFHRHRLRREVRGLVSTRKRITVYKGGGEEQTERNSSRRIDGSRCRGVLIVEMLIERSVTLKSKERRRRDGGAKHRGFRRVLFFFFNIYLS